MDTQSNPVAGYSQEDRPLLSYGVLVGVYSSAVGGLLLTAKGTGRTIPERPSLADLLLLGAATHKMSRVISKDLVTSTLRAPFAESEGSGSAGEINERPRGKGMRHAIGELLTCPFCLGQWIATGFAFGLVFAPRTTRLIAGIFSTVALSDFLHYAYEAAGKKAEQS